MHDPSDLDEFDLAELYVQARVQMGAEPERVMVAMLWGASRLASYLGRQDLHDHALARLKEEEAKELAQHRAQMGPGSGRAQ